MAVVGVINKALDDGQVRLYLAYDWTLVKQNLAKLPNTWVDTDAWDRARVWSALREGSIVVDAHFMWQYFEVAEDDAFGEDGHGHVLFDGPVVFLSDMLASLEQ